MTCDELLTSLRHFRPYDFTADRGFRSTVLILPPEPAPVGMAVSPKVAFLLKAAGVYSPHPEALPMLIDPRLTDAGCELHFEAAAWTARCEDQHAWASAHKSA